MLKKILIPVLLLTGIQPALSQPSSNSVYVDLYSGLSIRDNQFTSTWSPSPSINLNVRVPFYESQLEGGAQYIRFKGDAPTETDSDFHSTFLHVGWLYPLHITDDFSAGPAIRFGGTLMLFDESEVIENENGTQQFITDQQEFEFAYELALQGQYRLFDQLYITTSISYNRTLTEIPLEFTMVSAGFSFAFNEPEWLKKFVR